MKLIALLIVVLIAIALGFAIHQDPGYLLIAYHGWSIETSLWVGVILIIVAYLVITIVLKILFGLFGLSGRLHGWGVSRKIRKANALTRQGLINLAQGDFKVAEHQLIKASKHLAHPLTNYLSAAQAAQQLEQYELRDKYLRKAAKTTKNSEFAIGLTQAQLQIQSRQWEQALATLRHLTELKPQHPYVLKLLTQVYQAVCDWSNLANLLPALKKQKVFSTEKLSALTQATYIKLLNEHPDAWRVIPSKWQRNPHLVHAYLAHAAQPNEELLKIIEHSLKHDMNTTLLNDYANLKVDPAHQLKKVVHWLKEHPGQVDLLYAAAKLSFTNQLWGQAKDNCQQALGLKPTTAGYHLLAEIFTELKEPEQALTAYKRASSRLNAT